MSAFASEILRTLPSGYLTLSQVREWIRTRNPEDLYRLPQQDVPVENSEIEDLAEILAHGSLRDPSKVRDLLDIVALLSKGELRAIGSAYGTQKPKFLPPPYWTDLVLINEKTKAHRHVITGACFKRNIFWHFDGIRRGLGEFYLHLRFDAKRVLKIWPPNALLPDKEIEIKSDARTARARKPAPDAIVDREITRVYDQCEQNKSKPPNVRELVHLVRLSLNGKGYHASGLKIQDIAKRDKHRARRRPRGVTLASERRKSKVIV